MGQTLTHGIYLPDEGERNCYNGLAGNWQLLDGAVGTIAEHTEALAEKAPLVHTHTKSDVTDLFNSANVWTGQNTFSDHTYIYGQWKGLYFKNPEVTAGIAPSGDKRNYISFLDSNGYALGSIVLNVTGANSTWLQTGVSAKDTNDSSQSVYCGTQYRVYGNGEKYFNPSTNGDTYLGASTLQWKSVYAQSYYYNGTAWGLDKENVWSKTNYFSPNIFQKAFTARASIPSSNEFATFIISDSNNASVMTLNYANRTTGVRDLSLRVYDYSGNTNGVKVDKDANNNYSFCSINPNDTIDLGTSTNKWKSLNGINPGALSLPNYSDNTYIDISGSIVPPSGQTTINYSGEGNQYTPPVDGWLSIRCDGATFLQVYRNSWNCPGTTASRQDASGRLVVTLPVLKNTTYTIKINTSGTTNVFQLYPCLGNV